MRIVGTNGADEILGSGLDETLIGGAGDDRLIGGNGFDTYVFNPGFGDDTISEATGTNGGAIRFGAGIAPGDVSFVRPLNTSLTSARDLEVRVGDDTILIDNFYSSDNTSSVPVGRISQVEFANGDVSGFDEILPLILVEDRAAAEDDSITLMSGQTVNVEALVNDTGPYPTGLSIVSISAPDHGFASLTEEGRLIYRAPTSFTGEDSFDYVINDGTTPNATGTVFVTIREGDEPLSIADAQTVAYLYEAALDRDGTIDAAGLNFWIDARADGLTERELAEFFLTSREFINNFGNPESLSDESFVRSLYENVLDRTADSEGLAFWLSISRQPNFGHEDLLLAFAASEENLLGSPEIATLTFTETEEWIIF